jgi:hypothetical protein
MHQPPFAKANLLADIRSLRVDLDGAGRVSYHMAKYAVSTYVNVRFRS